MAFRQSDIIIYNISLLLSLAFSFFLEATIISSRIEREDPRQQLRSVIESDVLSEVHEQDVIRNVILEELQAFSS